jgi:NAD(P)H-dependent FMN reductase
MKFLVLAGSMRKDSLNVKLASIIEEILKKEGSEVTSISFISLDIPLYNEDVEKAEGIPEGIKRYAKLLHEADAWVICSPEYNYSMPGTLKNMIDWLSRIRPVPFSNKQILLLAASPSPLGGVRGLSALRVPLEGCNGFVFPQMYTLPKAHEAFSEQGQLKEASALERLNKLIKDFKVHAEKITRS